MKTRYFPDMVHSEYKLLVEHYGNKYHANPRDKRFGPDDAIIKIGRIEKTAKQIRERDTKRQKTLEDAGYQMIIVWEDVFSKESNREGIVRDIESVVNEYKNKS